MTELAEKEKAQNRISVIKSDIQEVSRRMNEAYQVYMECFNKRAEFYEEIERLEIKLGSENENGEA